MSKYKIAIFDSHPIHYKVPLYRKISKHPKIDAMVYFCSDYGAKHDYNLGFNTNINWKVNLSGIKYKFLRNYSRKRKNPPRGLINPGIINELFKNKYHAIIPHGYSSIANLFAFFGAIITRTPIFFRTEAGIKKEEPPSKSVLKRILLTPLFSMFDVFLYAYLDNKNFYRKYRVPERKLFFFPCSVDNDFYQKEAARLGKQRSKNKKKLGLPSSPTILFSGKLINRKRPMDLVKAYERVCKKLDCSLIFVGDGDERTYIEKYVKDKKLKNIFFLGFREEMSIFYSIADVLVLPSSYDPSPKAINEAMNFSLPIITTDKVGTSGDLVINGKNGFVYETGNINMLFECVLKALKNKEKMGKRSLEIVSQWNFEENANAIIKGLEYVSKNKGYG